jgi:DNA polymerase III alpha subunit
MKQNRFGELVFSESDVCDLIMSGRDTAELNGLILDPTVDMTQWTDILNVMPVFTNLQEHACNETEFHKQCQNKWHMPPEYLQLDIAQHVLSLCDNEVELQRCGAELLLFQERNLFDLLKYLKYLVDTMRTNHIIWGVGRGSSVASYVLYKLGVHRVDSIYYNLDIQEFLR